MIIQTEHLGKVSVTVEKDYHNINKCYDKLTIVEEENEFRTYISRKPVPNGVELTDRNYWIPFSSLERQIVIDYNKFKNDVLFASAFHEKLDPTLPEGVAIIKQLFDKDNNPIIPKVLEEAVSDEAGKTLKAKLAELTTTLSNTIDTYLNTYFADTIEKAEDIVNHPTYIGEDNYVYVWNRITKTYDKTSIYTRGEGFHVSKTFASVADMEAYTGTDLKEGDFVLIQSTPDDPDNAKLYTYSGTQGVYNYLVDMSGALGFTGKTPQFSIGTIIIVESTEQASASLSPDGTDSDGNPKYKLNLALPKGEKGTSDFVVVNDHSGAGDDPSKIYIPSAESHKQLYDGLIEDEKVIAEAITRVHESLDDHLKLTDIHLTESLLTDIHNNTEKNNYLNKVIFNGHEYLDLGLPSGNLWATMNLGATRVEEEGYHFMWGNTTQLASENDAIWSNCKYSNDGVKFAAKYNSHVNDNNYYHNSDIKFVVEPNDDPARKLWGGLWRMPTIDDLIELFDNLHSPFIETINGVEVLSFQPKNNFQDPFFYIPFCSYWENGVIHNYTDENNNKGCVIANSDITGIDALTSTVLTKGDTFTKNYAFPISAITGLCIRPVINLNK